MYCAKTLARAVSLTKVRGDMLHIYRYGEAVPYQSIIISNIKNVEIQQYPFEKNYTVSFQFKVGNALSVLFPMNNSWKTETETILTTMLMNLSSSQSQSQPHYQ